MYKNGTFHIENISAKTIVNSTGTPVFVYSKAVLYEHLNAYLNALCNHPCYCTDYTSHLLCYAVKANSNLSILKYIASQGAGFDIVSAGELERVLIAGGSPDKIVFSGVGKNYDELKKALDAGVYCFNVESEAELFILQAIAKQINKIAPVSLRINPDVDANTHAYISTGLKENKFGIDINQAEALYHQATQCSHLSAKGIDCHIGSQITQLQPFVDAADKILNLADRLMSAGIHLTHINMGGGLGVNYADERVPSITDYVNALCNRTGKRKLRLLLEPGRSVIAEAGVLISRVILTKNNGYKHFAIIDAGMNDLIRPALYGAKHRIVPLLDEGRDTANHYDIVGPVCETADCFAKQLHIDLNKDDYLVILNAGAYSMSMASNYNSRPRATEVMVDADQWKIIRRQETTEDMLRTETPYISGE